MKISLNSVIFSLLFYVANSITVNDLKIVRYNDKTHVCCNGVVHRRPPKPAVSNYNFNNVFTECCGQKLLSTSFKSSRKSPKQLCCNKTIYNISSDDYQSSCCGSDLMNNTESVCIDRKVKMNISKAGYDYYYNYNLCTDDKGVDEIYDNRIQQCCQGRVHARPTYNDLCCRNTTYNALNNTCCDGVIYGRNAFCCGNVTYDPSNSLCCNGKMHNMSYFERYDMQCCGDEMYSINHEICCTDFLLNRTTFEYESKNKVVDRKKENKFECCHLQLYNSNDQVCTEDGPQFHSAKRMKKCCGVLFKQVRWNDVWVPVEHPTKKDLETPEGTCGEEQSYFDGKRHCFMNKLYVSQPKRCEIYLPGFHIYEYYDPATQICCSGIVTNVTDDVRDRAKNSCCYEGKQDYIGYS